MTREALKPYTAPALEPVTLEEAKKQLVLESDTFADSIVSSQSIAPGSHAIAAAYSLKGSGVDVSAAGEIVALLTAGQNGAGGAVNVKLQESDTDVDGNYTDVTSGAFSQVTEANDNATYELTYSGTKRYIRAVATVAGAACEFGVSILLQTQTAADDALLTRYIKTARRLCEKIHNRAYITQTWDLYLDAFPADTQDIRIPLPPLQSVTSLQYKDTADVLQTLAATEYIVDTLSEPGRICLAYGKSWPATLDEAQAVQIRFVCGYGATAASVPDEVRSAILLKVSDLYEHRGEEGGNPAVDATIEKILDLDRVIPI